MNGCVALVFTDVDAGVTEIEVKVTELLDPLEPPEVPAGCKPLQACRKRMGRLTRAKCTYFKVALLNGRPCSSTGRNWDFVTGPVPIWTLLCLILEQSLRRFYGEKLMTDETYTVRPYIGQEDRLRPDDG